MTLISIITPTTRLENKTLESFFQIYVPEGYELEYIFIIDEPSKTPDNLLSLSQKYQNFHIEIIRNERNLGVSASRNIGIEKASGKFILFIDDDCIVKKNILIEYIKAYRKNPDSPGYIGLTNTPEPYSSFEHAVELSDMLHFFKIAKLKREFYWGITANLFLKREAINNIRFPKTYPKKGGGEDINFCLKIIENYNRRHKNVFTRPNSLKIFKCVPTAEVIHPFWKNNFKNYFRFFRWGYGDVNLHKDFPQYCFRQFPNYIEYTIILLLVNFFGLFMTLTGNFFWNFKRMILYLLIVLFCMTLWEIYYAAKKFKSQRRKFSFRILIKAVFIRQLNDLGRIFHQFPKIWNITRRWDYFCTRESIKYERSIALKKFFGFLTITIVFFVLIMIIF